MKKMNKEELVEYLIKNFYDEEEDEVHLTNLDFGDCNVNLSGLKTDGGLDISYCEVKYDMNQSHQTVGLDLYQHSQNVGNNLDQTCQTVKGKLQQDKITTVTINEALEYYRNNHLYEMIQLVKEEKEK